MPNSTSTKLVLAASAAFATVLLAACGGGSEEAGGGADSGPEGVTVYSGRIAPLVGPAIDMHEAEVGRDVLVRFGDSAQLAATIHEEGERSPADVFFSQDAGALAALEREGLLAPLPREVLRRVPARFRSPAGRWVGISARARTIAYDTRELSAAELPGSVLELTDERWRGRVGWAPTNASLQAYVTALRQVEGEDVARSWLEGMVANETQTYESNTPIRDAVAAGEIELGLVNHYYVAAAKAEHEGDYPVEVHFPRGDLGSMVNVAGVAILASSERRGEAIEFVRFMLGREAQTYFSESSREYPVVRGVPEPEGVPPLDALPSPRLELSDLADLEGTLRLMRETGAL